MDEKEFVKTKLYWALKEARYYQKKLDKTSAMRSEYYDIKNILKPLLEYIDNELERISHIAYDINNLKYEVQS